MIPRDKYICPEGWLTHFVTDTLIKKYHSADEYSRFDKWMRGKTMVVLQDGSYGIYSWDYEKWLDQGKPSYVGD